MASRDDDDEGKQRRTEVDVERWTLGVGGCIRICISVCATSFTRSAASLDHHVGFLFSVFVLHPCTHHAAILVFRVSFVS
jgi:hypothetical protein